MIILVVNRKNEYLIIRAWSCLWMLLLSSVGTLVIEEGGLRPSSFLMSLLVVALSCPWMLLLSSVDTLALGCNVFITPAASRGAPSATPNQKCLLGSIKNRKY